MVAKFELKRAEYNASPSKCLFCGTTFPFEKRRNKFCDSSCAASFNNKGIKRNECLLKPRSNCRFCNGKLKTPTQVFCKQECQHKYQYKIYIEKWLNNEVEGHIAGASCVSSHVKRWLIEKWGNKCSKCGWAEIHPVTGKVPIQVDHIDGNSENSRPDNLRLLCPNCHSLTTTYGNSNNGNGRKGRRDRYKRVSGML